MANPKTILGLLLLVGSVLPFDMAFAQNFCQEDVADIPSNRIVTGTRRNNNCFTNLELTTSPLPSGTSSRTQCSIPGHGVPAGFVVTRVFSGTSARVDCNGGSAGNGNSREIRRPSTSSNTTICSSLSPVPTGFVVVDRGSNSSSCNGATATIRRASSSSFTTICVDSPIPTGFILDSRNISGGCRTGETRRLRIRGTEGLDRTDEVRNCVGHPVPPGFVVVRTQGSTSCRGNNSTGTANIISLPGDADTVCSASEIPAGFVVTQVDNFSQCGNSVGFRIFNLSNFSGSLDICSNTTPLPSGFVVTQVVSSSQCSSNSSAPRATIRIPSDTSTTTICTNFGFPDTHGIINTLASSSICSSGGSGPRAVIGPISNGGLFCDIGQGAPDGQVITRVASDSSCPTGLSLSFAVPNPNGIGICVRPDQPIPAQIPTGYVINQVDTASSLCEGVRVRANIRVPNSQGDTAICGISPIPSGFGIIRGNLTSSFCDNSTAAIIRPLDLSDPNLVCVGSPIPDGFVITGVNLNASSCGIFGAFEVTAVSSPINVCFDSPIPPGYVTTRIFRNNACQDFASNNALTIQLPSQTGETAICSEVPEGFRLVRTSPTSQCGSQSFFNIIRSNGDVIPSTFVNPIRNVDPANVPTIRHDCGGSSQTGGFVGNQARNTSSCP